MFGWLYFVCLFIYFLLLKVLKIALCPWVTGMVLARDNNPCDQEKWAPVSAQRYDRQNDSVKTVGLEPIST